MNYQDPVKLHDYRFYGQTFTERELLKFGKAQVLTKNILLLKTILHIIVTQDSISFIEQHFEN